MTGTCCRTLFIPPAEPEEKLLTEYEEQSRRSTLFFFKITTQIFSTPLIWDPFLLPDEDCPQSLEMDGRCLSDVCGFHFTSCVCRIKAYTRKYFSSRTRIYWRCFRNKPRRHFCFSPLWWEMRRLCVVLGVGTRPPASTTVWDSTGINHS